MIESSSSLSTKSLGISVAPLSPNKCYKCEKALNEDQIKKCSRCREAIYCGKECQNNDWKSHKVTCQAKESQNQDVTKNKTDFEENKINQSTTTSKTETEGQRLIKNHLNSECEGIRSDLTNFDKSYRILFNHPDYDHAFNTRKAILQTSTRLDPNESIVLVFGAQFFNGKFVEPLPELLNRCKKMILVDVDLNSLNELKALLNSPKVIIKQKDLTNSFDSLVEFEKSLSEKPTQAEFIEKSVKLVNKITKETINRAAGISEVLEKDEKADYVISSLVASQLAVNFKDLLFSLFENIFKVNLKQLLMKGSFKEIIQPFEEIYQATISKHTEDVSVCTKLKGKIYLADTMSVNDSSLGMQKLFETLISKASKDARFTQGQWMWVKHPSRIYKVLSITADKDWKD